MAALLSNTLLRPSASRLGLLAASTSLNSLSAPATTRVASQARLFSSSRAVLHGDDKPSHTEYHRHSTRYRVTPRSKLKQLENIKFPHYEPKKIGDYVSLKIVKLLRKLSDMYFKDHLVERAVMLETIAAVPGMVAGMSHHARSLRRMEHCQWIKPTMDEAENERMHLMTFMDILQPTKFQRYLIVGAQGAFMSAYTLFYILFPKTCHRFVGYLEEEACHTYTLMLEYIDQGRIENVPVPKIAKDYWGLPEDALLRDVVLVIRADEADHRLVNHHLSDLYAVPEIKRPWDVFQVNLDHPEQLPEEQTRASGLSYAEYIKLSKVMKQKAE